MIDLMPILLASVDTDNIYQIQLFCSLIGTVVLAFALFINY